MKHLLLALIAGYRRWISPVTPGCCRFEPSCSCYAALCVEHAGPLKGCWLTAKRLLRCNPLFAGGFDPPPLPECSHLEPDWKRLSVIYGGIDASSKASAPLSPSPSAVAPSSPPGA